MRLFTAILFNDNIKDKIDKVKNDLANISTKGKFTLKDNLHLTLVFLGEVEYMKIDKVKRAIDNVDFAGFDITFNKLGKFSKRDGDIYWLGLDKENPKLLECFNKVSKELATLGFTQDKFTPHVTLGRRVVLKNGERLENISLEEEIKTRADRISLMKSERVNNVLTYTEIYSNKK